MSGTTPNYGWPFQSLTDAPNGASLGHDSLIAADATLAAQVAAILAKLNDGTYSEGTLNTTAIGTGWTTLVPTMTTLGTGVTVAGSTITLAAGIWEIKAAYLSSVSSGGMAFVPTNNPPATGNFYGGNVSAITSATSLPNASATIKSTGAQTVFVQSFLGVAGTPSTSRLTIQRIASS